MTYDELLKKYPLKKFTHVEGLPKYSGFQESIEKSYYKIVDKKNGNTVAELTHTQVNEGMNTIENYWS